MEIVILVFHVILALALIGTILLQPPESSSLGGLGGSNPMASFGTRGQGNLLTRTTAILATLFIATSLILAIMSGVKPRAASILDDAPNIGSEKDNKSNKVEGADTPAMNAPNTPATTPAVPLAK